MGVIKEPLGSLIIGSCLVAEEVKHPVECWAGGCDSPAGAEELLKGPGLDPTQGVRPHKVQLSAFREEEISLGEEEEVEVEKVLIEKRDMEDSSNKPTLDYMVFVHRFFT